MQLSFFGKIKIESLSLSPTLCLRVVGYRQRLNFSLEYLINILEFYFLTIYFGLVTSRHQVYTKASWTRDVSLLSKMISQFKVAFSQITIIHKMYLPRLQGQDLRGLVSGPEKILH